MITLHQREGEEEGRNGEERRGREGRRGKKRGGEGRKMRERRGEKRGRRGRRGECYRLSQPSHTAFLGQASDVMFYF